MAEKKTINLLVAGGEVSAGPPLAPQLGPLGINILEVVNQLNKLTADFKGMRVPVSVIVDPETKQFSVEVGVPTVAALVVKEAGIEKGSGKPNTELVGNLSMDQVVKIARLKMSQSYAFSLKSAAKEVAGTCVSIGVKIENHSAKEALKEIEEGKWDSVVTAAQ